MTLAVAGIVADAVGGGVLAELKESCAFGGCMDFAAADWPFLDSFLTHWKSSSQHVDSSKGSSFGQCISNISHF